jgi:hypothetical protein
MAAWRISDTMVGAGVGNGTSRRRTLSTTLVIARLVDIQVSGLLFDAAMYGQNLRSHIASGVRVKAYSS